MRRRRAALVVNTRSRTGEQTFREARERLASLGVPLDTAYAVHDPARIPETVHGVLNEGCDLIVVGGGDGTVSSVVDLLAHHHAVLGLLPLGTANDFARTLQIPADPVAACDTLAKGRLVDVDLGLVGDNYFVNVASIGLAVDVTGALSPRLKKRAGSLAYPVAALKAFLRHQPFTARLTFPDGDHEPMELDNLLQVAVGNGRFYGGGNVVAPDAGIDDQTLDVYAIQRGRHRDLLGVARHFKSGHFVRKENVTHITTSRVELEADPAQSLNIDGEVVARTPQQVSVAHNALRVLVPQESAAARLDVERPRDRPPG
ncbi:MAG: lipid kinase [Propionibacteriales bacterium]|nr:lipid kinase [Propionibacteriales bacterium]